MCPGLHTVCADGGLQNSFPHGIKVTSVDTGCSFSGGLLAEQQFHWYFRSWTRSFVLWRKSLVKRANRNNSDIITINYHTNFGEVCVQLCTWEWKLDKRNFRGFGEVLKTNLLYAMWKRIVTSLIILFVL